MSSHRKRHIKPLFHYQTALKPCPECAQKTAKKPEMADKSLETDDSLASEL